MSNQFFLRVGEAVKGLRTDAKSLHAEPCPFPSVQIANIRCYPKGYIEKLTRYVNGRRSQQGFDLHQAAWSFWNTEGRLLLQKEMNAFREAVRTQSTHTQADISAMFGFSKSQITALIRAHAFGPKRVITPDALIQAAVLYAPRR